MTPMHFNILEDTCIIESMLFPLLVNGPFLHTQLVMVGIWRFLFHEYKVS